ncbi:Metallo-dependent phosphatase-like protein [Jimgerdemannia flammicorona]|uniref:Metallo-dependent phosphatase-like protein n=1 Tax=Jimgerdemannia flammicorona TaxID=994334 RepID=A0A433DNA7_9FUNG|nr:Metallo-dependent phosphatase-like protein [Jimgerdemannia flammicorona]
MHEFCFLVCLVLSTVVTNSGHVQAFPVFNANKNTVWKPTEHISELSQNPWTKLSLNIADTESVDYIPVSVADFAIAEHNLNSINNSTDNSISCSMCKAVVKPLRKLMFSNSSQSLALFTGVILCKLFRINSPNVCEHIVPIFGPWAFTVLSHTFFEVDHICGLVGSCPKQNSNFDEWEVTLPAKHTEPDPDGNQVETQQSDGEDEEDAMYVMHLSDWHHDPEYREGYEADCDEPLCCRVPPANPTAVKRSAGKWGDFQCDSPRVLLMNMLEYIPTVVPRVDLVVMTGDQPPHDIWLETVDSMLNVTRTTARDLGGTFYNHLNHIKVFPTIGNHDAIPANSFPTSRTQDAPSSQWVYDELAEQWSVWLPNTTTESLRTRGGYSAIASPGLKIISLNTNFFYRLNWWMLMRPRDEPDPEGTLGWLVNELQQAENDGDKVFIIGHMSPIHLDADHVLGMQFARVVARYHDIIAGQFYGHSHFDEFQIFYDVEKQRRDNSPNPDPINMAYLGPSVTPFTKLNPAFRVYKYSRKTHRLLNHYTYSFDLEEANKPGNEPQWYLLYDAKTAYGLKDLNPTTWHDLTTDFLVPRNVIPDQQTFSTDGSQPTDPLHKYATFSTRNPAYHFPNCIKKGSSFGEASCRKRAVCQLRGGKSGPYGGSDLCDPISGKAVDALRKTDAPLRKHSEGAALRIAGILVGWHGAFEDQNDQDGEAVCRS